jgi:hypothetical protein
MRGDLIEVGPTVFKPIHREMHFLSQRTTETQLDRIKRFREWLLREVRLSGVTVQRPARVPRASRPR